MTDSDNDSDADLLDLLLDENEGSENTTPESSAPSKITDFNFLDEKTNTQPSTSEAAPKKDSPKKYNDLSSDEEDKDYFDRKHYSDFGRDIKDILNQKKKDQEQKIFTEPFRTQNNESITKPKTSTQPPTSSLPTKTAVANVKTESKGIYNDPVFGLGITKPLISSTELIEKMRGRKAVTIGNLKSHVTSPAINDDWVVAGVLVNKSPSMVSSKGSQYCIWKLGDLSMSMNVASIFLFGNSYKTFWKTTVGTIVGVLNPTVLENRDKKDYVSLSVDNPSKIMIMGTSRDMGRCKSKKKNGDPCNAIVNIRQCEYCVYHVKQEYKSFSRRPEISANAKGMQPAVFGIKKKPQNAMMNEMQQVFTVKSKRSEKSLMKDRALLNMLRAGSTSSVTTDSSSPKVKEEPKDLKPKLQRVDRFANQTKKDLERIAKLKSQEPPKTNEGAFSLQSLSSNSKDYIDLSVPISKQKIDAAKKKALEYIQKKGGIKAANPNKIHPNKEKTVESNKRKKLEDVEENVKEQEEKKGRFSIEFQKLMGMKSNHTDLIEQSEIEDREKYFDKLEVKERMEEKMITTYMIDCKAVICTICKYKAFSTSELCKERKHPIRLVDAVKRFFKCGDCGNRTVCLDRIPVKTCSKCSSSNWLKTGMMDEKRLQVKPPALSIRGDEEKFYGSAINGASLDLVVPD